MTKLCIALYLVCACVLCLWPAEIDLATSHREFAEWRWMPLQQLPGAVVPFKAAVYEAVAAEFGPAVEAVKVAELEAGLQ